MHTPIEFFVRIPADLFRSGAPSKPRFDYIRTMPPRDITQTYDLKIDPVTNLIDAKSGGLSMFDSPNYSFGPDWWVVPIGTKLPPGFTISKDLTDGKFRGHYTIRSLSNIHIDKWKAALKEWAEEHAVHIKDYVASKKA